MRVRSDSRWPHHGVGGPSQSTYVVHEQQFEVQDLTVGIVPRRGDGPTVAERSQRVPEYGPYERRLQ